MADNVTPAARFEQATQDPGPDAGERPSAQTLQQQLSQLQARLEPAQQAQQDQHRDQGVGY